MPRDQSSASRLVRNVFAVVGRPVLRMTAFHVPESVLIMVATVLPVQRSRFATVPKLPKRAQEYERNRERLDSDNQYLFYFLMLAESCFGGPGGI